MNQVKKMVEKNERILWLDIARAIAIILVVCGHCDNFLLGAFKAFQAFFSCLYSFSSAVISSKTGS